MSEVIGERRVRIRADGSKFEGDTRKAVNSAVRRVAAFTGIGLGLREVVGQLGDAVGKAREAADVLGQTRAAVQAAGLSWGTYGKQIEDAANKQAELFGLDDEDLLKSFTLLVRATKDVNKAMELNAVAADVARGRNMDLVSAAQLLVRVQAGQVGSLRRLGI